MCYGLHSVCTYLRGSWGSEDSYHYKYEGPAHGRSPPTEPGARKDFLWPRDSLAAGDRFYNGAGEVSSPSQTLPEIALIWSHVTGW